MHFPALADLPLDPVVAAHPGAQRVYLRLLSVLDFSEARDIKAWLLAEELCIEKETVLKAFRILIERGFLIDQGRSQNNVRRFTLAWSRARPPTSTPQPTTNAA